MPYQRHRQVMCQSDMKTFIRMVVNGMLQYGVTFVLSLSHIVIANVYGIPYLAYCFLVAYCLGMWLCHRMSRVYKIPYGWIGSLVLCGITFFAVECALHQDEKGCKEWVREMIRSLKQRKVSDDIKKVVYGLPVRSVLLEFIGVHSSEHSETIAQFRVLHTLSEKFNEGSLLLFVNRMESSGPKRTMPYASKENLYYYEWAADENVVSDDSLIYGDMPVPLWFLWSSRSEDVTQDLFDEDMFVRHYKDRVLKTVKGKE